jgi:hypothetical protein
MQDKRRLTLMLSDRLLKQVQNASAASEQSISEFVRSTLRERLQPVSPSTERQE